MSPKLCECGCGQPAPIAKRTNTARGYVVGQPVRFILGHRGRLGPSLEERLWAKVRKGSEGECWPWIGYVDKLMGYGWLKNRGRMVVAHRTAWEFTNGPIPAGMLICHHCDNPPCCNPAHLFLGTQAMNLADRDAKGRAPDMRGSRNASAKITEDDVRTIRKRHADGERQKALAAEYGVAPSNISLIVHCVTWPHVH